MNFIHKRHAAVATLFVMSIACGAEQGQLPVDASPDTLPGADASVDAQGPLDARLPAMDGAGPEAQPTQEVTWEVAFAELAGSYTGKAANVSGSAASKFDAGSPYTFTIDAAGSVTVTTKTAAESFVWSQHGRTIERNSNNKVTAVTLQDANERVLVITYRPTSGILDMAGAYYDPQGAWYLTEISKP